MAPKKKWDYDSGIIYDEDGNEAAYRADGTDDDAWEYQAGRICAAMSQKAPLVSKKKPAPFQEVVEFIALNDEPEEWSEQAMSGYASVHVAAVVYGMTTLGVARAVVRFRQKEACR